MSPARFWIGQMALRRRKLLDKRRASETSHLSTAFGAIRSVIILMKLFSICTRPAMVVLSRLYPLYQHWLDRIASKSFADRIKQLGPGSAIRHPCYLRGAQHIRIGSNFVAGPGLRIEAWDRYLDCVYHPEIIIGDNVCINFDAHIGAIDQLTIGNHVLIGSHVLIIDHSHGHTSADALIALPIHRPLVSRGRTVIEDNVWIGEGACILAGVRVGRNAVIGANAVVTRDVAAGDVVAGIAADSIRQRLAQNDPGNGDETVCRNPL